jgi:phosphohistidine phosphatase
MAMLELFLIRHGVAAERGKDWPDDSKRPLTPEGLTRPAQAGPRPERPGHHVRSDRDQPAGADPPDADVFSEELKSKPPIVTSDALAPAGTPAAVVQEITKHVRKARVALVGHEPNLGELAAQLIGARNPWSSRRGASAGSTSTCCRPRGAACCAGS